MSLLTRVLLGALAVVPLLATLLFILGVAYLIQADGSRAIELAIRHQVAVLLFNLVILVVTNRPFIFYLVHAARNKDLADRKVVWILLIVFLGVFVLPIYWFLFVWRENYYDA